MFFLSLRVTKWRSNPSHWAGDCFVALLLAMTLLPSPVSAVSISPSKAFVTIDPGASQTMILKIKNDGPRDARYKLLVLGAKQNENGDLFYGANFWPAETWVQPESNVVEVGAGQERKVIFEINAPRDAAPGSNYLSLQVEPSSSAGAGGVQLQARVASLLILQVAGSVREELEILQWSPRAYSWRKAVWPFELIAQNNGPVEVETAARVVVKNWLGREKIIKEIELGKILAGAIRVSHQEVKPHGVVYCKGLCPTIYTPDSKIWLPGRYTVKTEIKYGLTKQTARAEAQVWFWPLWSLLAGLLLIVVGSLAGSIALRKARSLAP
ncbi:hypothetical protein EPN28_00245 [Patescibacteria group bacterium]|nr:MAG: hypothetical protein EPN28_00245 [Patescibacteria group bacterium]